MLLGKFGSLDGRDGQAEWRMGTLRGRKLLVADGSGLSV